MAPEVMEEKEYDRKVDIYSLGCTLHYLLTGEPPFPGGTVPQKLLRHQQAPPPSLPKSRRDVPAGVRTTLHRMLAKRPEDRVQSAAEVVAVLSGKRTPVASTVTRAPSSFRMRNSTGTSSGVPLTSFSNARRTRSWSATSIHWNMF